MSENREPQLGCTDVVSLLERIAAAVEKNDGLPRNEVYEQLLLSKDKEIWELERKLAASKRASWDDGYDNGFKKGSQRIKNHAYKLKREGNTELCELLLSVAKVISTDDEG